MASTGELVVQVIVAASGGSAVAAAINSYFSRRTTAATVAKTQAETGRTTAEITGVGAGAASVQVDTSLKLMQWMDGQLDDLRIDLAAARAEAHEARQEAVTARREVEQARAEVDFLRGLLTSANIPIPPRGDPP